MEQDSEQELIRSKFEIHWTSSKARISSARLLNNLKVDQFITKN